jgi:hypothetical protein
MDLIPTAKEALLNRPIVHPKKTQADRFGRGKGGCKAFRQP